VLEAASSASAAAPVLFRKGDVHTALARLIRQSPGQAVPVGDLEVTWQRSRRAYLGPCLHVHLHGFWRRSWLCSTVYWSNKGWIRVVNDCAVTRKTMHAETSEECSVCHGAGRRSGAG
jgi:hypothetical protein